MPSATIGAVRRVHRLRGQTSRARRAAHVPGPTWSLKPRRTGPAEDRASGSTSTELEWRMTRSAAAAGPETAADAVLQHLHPIDEVRGFTSEILRERGRSPGTASARSAIVLDRRPEPAR